MILSLVIFISMSNTFIKFIFFLSFTKLLLLCSFFPFYLTLYLSQHPNTFTKFIFFHPYLCLNMMHHKNIMVQESIPLPYEIYMFLFPHFTLSLFGRWFMFCLFTTRKRRTIKSWCVVFPFLFCKSSKDNISDVFLSLYRFLVSEVRLSGLRHSHSINSLLLHIFNEVSISCFCSKKSWLF